MQIRSTTHQQLWVPDLPPNVSFTDWASCHKSPTRDDETRRVDGSVQSHDISCAHISYVSLSKSPYGIAGHYNIVFKKLRIFMNYNNNLK